MKKIFFLLFSVLTVVTYGQYKKFKTDHVQNGVCRVAVHILNYWDWHHQFDHYVADPENEPPQILKIKIDSIIECGGDKFIIDLSDRRKYNAIWPATIVRNGIGEDYIVEQATINVDISRVSKDSVLVLGYTYCPPMTHEDSVSEARDQARIKALRVMALSAHTEEVSLPEHANTYYEYTYDNKHKLISETQCKYKIMSLGSSLIVGMYTSDMNSISGHDDVPFHIVNLKKHKLTKKMKSDGVLALYTGANSNNTGNCTVHIKYDLQYEMENPDNPFCFFFYLISFQYDDYTYEFQYRDVSWDEFLTGNPNGTIGP
jgi:hypothetical protein